MHSVFLSPIVVSASALSKSSPTKPIKGLIPSIARVSQKRTTVQCELASELSRLRLNSGRGVHYLSVTFSQTLLDAGIAPSVRTTGDSNDNALSESNNALYKAEMVRPQGGFKGTTGLEWARLLSIDWFNN